MAEKEKEEKHLSFEKSSSGTSFFVKVTSDKKDLIKKLGGTWNQKKKAYVFLTSYLQRVEKALGLEPGESGIKDPNRYFPVVFTGELREDKGRVALEKALAEFGFKWNKQRKQFEGSVGKLKDIESYVQEV